MKAVVLLGPPGSGKGTQAHLLSQTLRAPLVGMGELIRKEIAKKTPLGEEICHTVNAGSIPQWSSVRGIFIDHLRTLDNPLIIFDGVPRNQEQADDIQKELSLRGGETLQAFFLDVPSPVIVHRTTHRYQCTQCGTAIISEKVPTIGCVFCKAFSFVKRQDDQQSIVENRLRVFHESIDSLLAHYKMQNVLTLIDGTDSIENIHKTIVHKLRCLESPFKESSLLQ
jgi:adenylate kinase